ADAAARRVEPGHPLRHAMVTAPATQACTACHYGDASIGLHFRGLSQLPPGAAGGPEIDGTTDSLLHRSFFINDPAVTPPDVHHASGLHCVDCHTVEGVMGDGRLLSKMEQATEITCEACHGTFDERSGLETERGHRLKHLFVREDEVWMRSKVTGEEHRIKQAVDVVTEGHKDYNAEAARAMTGAHGNIACYTCHAGWNVNFLGFHFYRNEALTQMDLLTGERTPGRVTTQEKVFTTWKSFYAGLDEKGRVAPYLTGFSTMGTVDDADGNRILDQVLPVTKNGRSGLTMIHHQLHSTRPTARSCVECHRASETWGMGSSNFRLSRQVAYVADRRGVEAIAFDRENPQNSVPIGKVVLSGVVDLELDCDSLQGHGRTLFAAESGRGIHSLDVKDPREIRHADFHMTVNPRGMDLSGEHLFVADGVGGLKIFRVADPGSLELVGAVPTIDAHEVEVRWPYAYVADGPGGLLVVDVRYPVAPKVVGGLGLADFTSSGEDGRGLVDLDVLFQYSRPLATKDGLPSDERTQSRRLVAVCDDEGGPVLVDATEPEYMFVIGSKNRRAGAAEARASGRHYTGLELRTHVDVAAPQGGEKTVERDNLYFTEVRDMGNGQQRTRLRIVDVSDPERQQQLSTVALGNSSESLTISSWYNAPFLRPLALHSGSGGLRMGDLSNSKEVVTLGSLSRIRRASAFVAEEFPLDAMVDEDRGPLKDVSHPGSRWLQRSEIDRALSVTGDALGTIGPFAQKSIAAASSARAMFANADKDRSGLLTGDELKLVGGTRADDDGDGRVTLFELAKLGEPIGGTVAASPSMGMDPEPASEEEARRRDPRVGLNGDLSQLLDRVDPFDFDKKKDGKLTAKEFKVAFFAALDLSGDGRLSIHELSRLSGSYRSLRFGDEASQNSLGKLDNSGGGSLSLREFSVPPDDWAALDRDADGAIQLDPRRMNSMGGRGVDMPIDEWPQRRDVRLIPVSPTTTRETLLKTFDSNGDGVLSKRELSNRADLFQRLDSDRSTLLEADEMDGVGDAIANSGVEAVPDGFLERWDLNGDGKVEASEIPELITTLLRSRSLQRRRR
ncbi:MAG: Ca2+-binding EF-hand superfamily protein, partial [Planctomycetota bacterium]